MVIAKTSSRSIGSAAGVLGLVLLCAGAAGPVRALDPQKAFTQLGHDHWTSADGLPESSVERVIQTPDGYLWAGSEEGLARFDGSRFTLFNRRNTPGLTNHNIRSLAVRRAGGLWVGTWRGLFILQDGRARPVPVVPEDPLVIIESLFESRTGTLWVGTQGHGVVRIGGGRSERYDASAGLPSNLIWALQEDALGTLWIGTNRGLARLSGGRIESFAGHPGIPQGSVGAFALAADGSLWIGTTHGLALYRSGGFRPYLPAGRLSRAVDALAIDRDGILWVGTRSGLARVDGGTLRYFGPEDGLADSTLRSLWVDHEGSLWIGTESGGLERLWEGRFTVFGKPEGLADNRVFSLLEDRQGSLWIGTMHGGLSRLANGAVTTWARREGLISAISALYEDRRGTLWIGTADGLYRFAAGRIVPFTTGGKRFGAYISGLFEDALGNLWIGTDRGLGRLSAKGFKIFTDEMGSCDDVEVLEPDLGGGLWIGTSGGGLLHFKDGRFTAYSVPQGLSENDVLALHQDADGTLWAGTNGGGLDVIRAGRISAVSTRQGLLDDVILQILDDGQGSLWLTSNRGISRVAKTELLDLVAGRRGSVSSSTFDAADGLRDAQGAGGAPAALRAADGRLWFATMGGAAAVDPRRLAVNRIPPPVQIEQLLVDGGPVERAPNLRLAPASRRFEIAYTALTFLAPRKARFRVKLAGFDRDWIEMGNRRTAVYTNLPPGRYRFAVQAANADGVWNRAGAGFSFVLQPRFYQTPWFVALVGLAAGVGVWGTYRLRLGAMRTRLTAVLAERTRIARELHDTSAQDMLAAALQLELAAGELPAAPEAARERVVRSAALVESGLAAARRSVAALRAAPPRHDGLPTALERLAASLVDGRPLDVQVAAGAPRRPLPVAVEEHLLGIAREALSNALRHAEARHVRVELIEGRRQVQLRVSDDGRGFPAEAPAPAGGGHFGIVGMRERATAVGGDLAVRSVRGQGTVVEATVPLRRGRR